jgi:serine/threonine protein kinase
MGSVLGTVAYMPPEIALERPYTSKCDQYSLGAFLYEMLCGYPPFYAGTKEKILEGIKGAHLRLPSRASRDVRELVGSLLNRDDKMRPTIAEVKRHPALSHVDWDRLGRR